MAENSYIKDLVRYPPGISKTADGFTFSPNYNDVGDSCVTINNDSFVSHDGTGLHQFKVFRTQFDSTPFTDTISTSTATTLIGNWFVARAVNHTATKDSPYDFLSLRGAMTMGVEFKFKQESCPRLDKIGGSKLKKLLCKALGGYKNLGIKCNAGFSIGRGISNFFQKIFRIGCSKMVFFADGEISFKIRGGYGSTGQFVCTLKDKQNTTRPPITLAENTWYTYNNLSGSFSTARSHPDAGLYTLTVRDFWTDDQMDMYINLPFSDSGLTRKATVKYGFQVLQYEHNNTTATPPTVCWIIPGYGAAFKDGPPTGVLDHIQVDDACSLNTSITAQGAVFPNLYPILAQFEISTDNTTWTNLGTSSTVLPSVDVTFVSATNTFVTSTYNAFYRLQLSSIKGTATIDTDAITLTTAEFETNWESPIQANGDFAVTYNINTNQFTYTNTYDSCFTYRLSVFGWNVSTNTTIEATLQGLTSISASNVPTGSSLLSSFTFSSGTGDTRTMNFTVPQTCTGTGQFLFTTLGEFGPSITATGGQTAPLSSKNLYPEIVYDPIDDTVTPPDPELKFYALAQVPCKWNVTITATGFTDVDIFISLNSTSGALTLNAGGSNFNLALSYTALDAAGGTVATSTQNINTTGATTLSIVVPTSVLPTATATNNIARFATSGSAASYTHSLGGGGNTSSITVTYQ